VIMPDFGINRDLPNPNAGDSLRKIYGNAEATQVQDILNRAIRNRQQIFLAYRPDLSKQSFGAPRCGSRNRKGTPCQLPAMHGRRRCALHCGKSSGPNGPRTESVEHQPSHRPTCTSADCLRECREMLMKSQKSNGKGKRAMSDRLHHVDESEVLIAADKEGI